MNGRKNRDHSLKIQKILERKKEAFSQQQGTKGRGRTPRVGDKIRSGGIVFFFVWFSFWFWVWVCVVFGFI